MSHQRWQSGMQVPVELWLAASGPTASQEGDPGVAGWAFVLESGPHSRVEAQAVLARSAHRAALLGLGAAVEVLRRPSLLTVHCAQQSIVDSINRDLARIRRGEFRKKQKNTDVWRHVLLAADRQGHHFGVAVCAAGADGRFDDLLARARRARREGPSSSGASDG